MRAFIARFAAQWGLDAERLEEYIGAQLGQRDDVSLEQLCLELRNDALRPILRDLYDRVRARLARGPCASHVDDALSQLVPDLVARYWRPSWSKPEGREHLLRYATKAVRRLAEDLSRKDLAQSRDVTARTAVQDSPEHEAIESEEAQQRAICCDVLRDLDCLIHTIGLSPAEAKAIVHSLRPDPTAGMTKREMETFWKAVQRGRKRLKRLRHLFPQSRRRYTREPAGCVGVVDCLGFKARFRVVDYSAGGIGLEIEGDSLPLEPGLDCTVRIYSGSVVVVRGARCVRIDSVDGKVRVGLQFHFPHPMPPLQASHALSR
jgi:hypothetical protein